MLLMLRDCLLILPYNAYFQVERLKLSLMLLLLRRPGIILLSHSASL